MARSLELQNMRQDWDKRARDDALYWVYTVHGRRFEDLADYYEDGTAQAERMIGPHLKEWGEDPAGKTILEIGCGVGRLFPGFARAGFSGITGVDVSPEMVSRGEEWCPVKGARFILVDGDRLSGVESASVDYCFSYNVFQHLPDEEILWRNLEEIARVVKSGGYVQFHFRGGYTVRQRLASMVPESLSPGVRLAYWSVRYHHPPNRKLRQIVRDSFKDPGHRDTWEFGVAVSPKRVVDELRKLEFTDVRIETDPEYEDGKRLWASGRKA